MPAGNPSPIIPTMLGGSASSQTSGAPFRTESDSRATGWPPPPAHQNDLFSRGFGIYSLFPRPGDEAKTLYSAAAAAKSVQSGPPFPGYLGPPTVPEAFYPTKFSFGSASGVRSFDSQLSPIIQPSASRPDSTAKSSFDQSFQPVAGKQTRQVHCQQQSEGGADKKTEVSKTKSLPNEVVVIKSELDETRSIKRIAANGDDDVKEGKIRSVGNQGEKKRLEKKDTEVQAGSGQANEPDSTECRTTTTATTTGKDGKNEDIVVSGSVDEDNLEKVSERRENTVKSGFEKCNVIDLSLVGSSSGSGPVGYDARTGNNDSQQCAKTKTPDSCYGKALTVNCRQYNQVESAMTAKASPTGRTLPLPSNNGGCSRTTPIAFKHRPQTPESAGDAKPAVGNEETVSIKMEPVEFHKYPNGSPYLEFASLNNLYNPSALKVLDRQVVNSVPYHLDSFETYSRQRKGYATSPGGVDGGFLRSSQGFLGSSSPYSSPPKIEVGSYKGSCWNASNAGESYLAKLHGETGNGNLRNSENESTVEGGGRTTNSSNITPCQVAEVTSASALLSPKIAPSANFTVIKEEGNSGASGSGAAPVGCKKEIEYPTSGQSTAISSTIGGALMKQRCQPRIEEVKMSPLSEASPPSILHRTVQSPASINVPATIRPPVYSGGIVCDDRPSSIWPAQAHNPGLWQYSAIDYPAFPPVGFQLIRDPITGHFLLIPASNFEALQRAILWPTYAPASSQMIIPPMSLQSSSSHFLLDAGNVSAVDFMSADALHRTATPQQKFLIPADNVSAKRKIVGSTLFKFEASENIIADVVPACDSDSIYTKPQSTVLSPRPAESSTNLIGLSSKASGNLRSQAESTVPCITSSIISNANDKLQSVRASTSPSQSFSPETGRRQLLPETKLTVDADRSRFELKVEVRNELAAQSEKEEKEKKKEEEQELVDDKRAVRREIEKRKEKSDDKTANVSEVNIKKEMRSPLSQVDISGLELLSNSIDRLEFQKSAVKSSEEKSSGDETEAEDKKELSSDACEGAVLLQKLKNGFFREAESNEGYEVNDSKGLGGLGLLCALAEQRFQEEIGNDSHRKTVSALQNGKKGKRNRAEEEEKNPDDGGAIFGRAGSQESNRLLYSKDCDFNKNYQKERFFVKMEEKETEASARGEECSSAPEDLPESGVSLSGKKGPGRPKKIKCRLSPVEDRGSRKSKEMSPPVLERQTDYFPCKMEDESDEDCQGGSMDRKCKADASKPPILTPSAILDPVRVRQTPEITMAANCEGKLNHDNLKKTFYKKSTDAAAENSESRKRKSSDSMDDSSSSSPSSASKRRKVGRPKKNCLAKGLPGPLTETIVLKKPKTKPNYTFQLADNEIVSHEKQEKTVESTSLPGDLETFEKDNKTNKIRPKLKAEPKIRESSPLLDESNLEDWSKSPVPEEAEDDYDENEEDQEDEDEEEKEDRKEETASMAARCNEKEDSIIENGGDEKFAEVEYANSKGTEEWKKIAAEKAKGKASTLPNCVLSGEHIKSDRCPVRTLTIMGGLFYAGQLSAIRAPDVYGITIDGERGNRPHIYSREEILRDTILEVKPEKAEDLISGTRICAYWSEQYRCLYPGTICAPPSPDSDHDDRFVNVEFDDGDSGKINIDDIRLLPDDYPIVEYDPNPLQSLSRRRRRTSGASVESHSRERRSIDSTMTNGSATESQKDLPPEKPQNSIVCDRETFLDLESERKHLKKKRREKLKRLQSLSLDGKKKHKKHRCSEEHRHHKHHKKHRKHKHKHGTRKNAGLNGREDSNHGPEKKRSKKTKSSVKSGTGKASKPKKCKERTDSVESRSKMAAFLPARQLWGWSGKGFKRPGAKGRARKEFYKTIQRGKERITVGDCAVFLSTGRPDRPYIGRIESMWESWGTNMIVRVKWFYHPEETVGCPATLEYPGALFESPHVDENDVQTISHKCEVLPLKEYTAKLGNSPHRYEAIYDNNDTYYLAGYYDPTNTTLKMEPGVK